MGATKSYREALASMNDDERKSFESGNARWRLTVDGVEGDIVCKDWKAESPFGSVHSAVVVQKGASSFDRPAYREAPNVNVVAWGRDADGTVKIARIRQPRPHSDDPEQPGNEHDPMVFGSIVMGFLERIIGKDALERFEKPEDGAKRECAEESGATAVKSVERPEYPWHNPNPTFVETWSDLIFVEVDLERVEQLKKDRLEPIYSAKYIPVAELRRCVAKGKDEDGTVYRMCTANSAWFVFFCCHPELF